MNPFKRYPKFYRIGKEETDGILFGEVHIEEKIDGANAQIWVSDGKVCCGSRNNTLCTDVDNTTDGTNMFNGFVEYVRDNESIRKLLRDNPDLRLYGEWLVRHTISYSETAYKKFYLFDVMEGEEWKDKHEVLRIADEYGIPKPQWHGCFTNPTEDDIMKHVGISMLGTNGEGVVLKNEDYVNKFGDRQYAKIVTEKFKEDNAVAFGGNNKFSETYWEVYIVNKYMTLARIEKIMNKLQPTLDKRLDLEHIPRVAQTAYHDMLTEEIWDIQKKVVSVNFQVLKRVATKKAIQIYKDVLQGDISVADKATSVADKE